MDGQVAKIFVRCEQTSKSTEKRLGPSGFNTPKWLELIVLQKIR